MPSKAKPVFHTQTHMNHRCPHSQIQTLYPNIKKEQNVLKNLLKKQKFQENPCHVPDTNMPIHFILDYNRLLHATATSNRLPGPCLQNSSILFAVMVFVPLFLFLYIVVKLVVQAIPKPINCCIADLLNHMCVESRK